jgi:hypothetical protein
MMPAGHPTVMTPDTLFKLKEAFLMGMTDKEACLYANDIAPATLYNYQVAHPEFLEKKEQWKNNPIVLARQSVVNGLKRNPQLALAFLERKLKSEFATRSEFTGKDGKDLIPKPIMELDEFRKDDSNQENK